MSVRLIEEKEPKVSNDDIKKLIDRIDDLEMEVEGLNTIVWGKKSDEDDKDSERDCFDENSIDRRLDRLEGESEWEDELRNLKWELDFGKYKRS